MEGETIMGLPLAGATFIAFGSFAGVSTFAPTAAGAKHAGHPSEETDAATASSWPFAGATCLEPFAFPVFAAGA